MLKSQFPVLSPISLNFGSLTSKLWRIVRCHERIMMLGATAFKQLRSKPQCAKLCLLFSFSLNWARQSQRRESMVSSFSDPQNKTDNLLGYFLAVPRVRRTLGKGTGFSSVKYPADGPCDDNLGAVQSCSFSGGTSFSADV